MRIDIVLDVICPWCFIGKRRLEQALALRPGDHARDRLAPVSAQSRHAARRHGAAGLSRGQVRRRASCRPHLSDGRRGRRHGRHPPSPSSASAARPTRATAHRLIRHAAAEGCADAAGRALFRAYFLDGRDIGDRADARPRSPPAAGSTGAAAERFLAGNAASPKSLAEDRGVRRIGINAVPCFIFDRQYAISGAQEPEFFLPVFDLVENGGAVSAAAE